MWHSSIKVFFLLGILLLLFSCAGDETLQVTSVRIDPAEATALLEDAFIEFWAIATYEDDSTGDVTSEMTWKSFSSFQTDTSTDLLFEDETSALAVLSTTGLFTIQATWPAFYDTSSDLKIYTRLTVE